MPTVSQDRFIAHHLMSGKSHLATFFLPAVNVIAILNSFVETTSANCQMLANSSGFPAEEEQEEKEPSQS